MKVVQSSVTIVNSNSLYTRTPETQTLKGNGKQFELEGNSSYPGKFQFKGKEIQFELAGN